MTPTSDAATPPAIACTVAASDSGGGSGLEADLKTFHRHNVYGTAVVTAVAAQNTRGVNRWVGMAPDLVREQLDAVATDLRPAAIKCGMVGSPEVAEAIADGLREHALVPFVLDPVMVSTAGDLLMREGTPAALREHLVPRAEIVTANSHEAHRLLGRGVDTVEQMEAAARAIVEEYGAKNALVTGGALPDELEMIDVFFTDGAFVHIRHPRVETSSRHGSGCTLSAAVTARLALGASLQAAVEAARDYVHRAMLHAPALGEGSGPLNHWA